MAVRSFDPLLERKGKVLFRSYSSCSYDSNIYYVASHWLPSRLFKKNSEVVDDIHI